MTTDSVEILESLQELIDYCWESEEKHFREEYNIDTDIDRNSHANLYKMVELCRKNGWTSHIFYRLMILEIEYN